MRASVHWRLPEALQVRNNLPALRIRQSGPRRHSPPQITVRQEPEQIPGRRLIHRCRIEWRSMFAPAGVNSMAFRAVTLEKLFSRQCGVCAALVRISPRMRGLRGRREARAVSAFFNAALARRSQRGAYREDCKNQEQAPSHGFFARNICRTRRLKPGIS